MRAPVTRVTAVAFAALLLAALPAAAPAAARLVYRGTVLPPRQVQALAEEALRSPRDPAALTALLGELVTRLQNLGYLDARATAALDTVGEPGLALEVVEGPRYRLGTVSIHAPSPPDSAAFASALALTPGTWASPAAIAEALDHAARVVSDQGYPYAQLGLDGWEPDSGRVRLRLGAARGPQVTISRVEIEGLKVTRTALAEKSMGRLRGLPYNRAAAFAARDRLAQLELFRSVTFQGLEGEGDWSQARLLYRVEEPSYNRFEGVVGVQGEAGTVGLARLELGNLLGTGRAVGLSWESRGHGVVHFAAHAAEPLVFGTPFRLEGRLEQQVQDTLYVRTRWGARGVYALSGQDRVEAGFEQERVVQTGGLVEEAQLQSTVFAIEHAALDAPLAPRRGVRTRWAAAQSFKREHLRPPGTRSARASAVEARTEWHRPLSEGSGFTLELHAAGRFSSERVLPVFERYPVGGAASLRGFDEEAFRVDRYALSRLEWRWFMGAAGQRAFLFWDHAWMGSRDPLPAGGDRFESLHRDGVGCGLRLQAAGGLVGVDYGLETGRPPLEGKIHLQLISNF